VHGEFSPVDEAPDVMTLRIRRIERARDFVALESIWSRLTHESGQTSTFLSYDWFWCCWHGVVPQHRPEILVVEDGNTPVAIIPLMRWKARLHGFPVRYISFLGWPHSPITDLVTTGQSNHVIELFLDHLIKRSDWDIAQLQQLSVTSPTLEALERIVPDRLSWRRDGQVAYPFLTIDGDWRLFCTTMSKPFVDIHRDIYATLQYAGDLRLEEHRLVDPQGSLFQEMLSVMALQTASIGKPPRPRQREFFLALTQRAAKNGWLSLWTLKLDGHMLALEYQLRSHSTVQVLAVGQNPNYHDLRPWAKLNLAILRVLFESGCTYEYRLGPAVQHDRLWVANDHHQTVSLKLYRPSIYTHLLAQLDGGTV
jgi:CelD/BcsL family acetyltransferase involved in cellulose biosynthesis